MQIFLELMELIIKLLITDTIFFSKKTTMGPCASIKQTRKSTHTYNHQPAGTNNLKGKQLPRLQFHATFANVKLKQYPYKLALPIFSMRHGECLTLAQKFADNDSTIIWKIFEKFDFQMTEYELRKNFLEVQIRNENKDLAGSIKINLFLITTGPFHQNFEVEYKNGKKGRISFDLKISQIIELKIQSHLAEIDLIKKHPGQQFSYSIKTIVGENGYTSESGLSYPASVLLQKLTDKPRQGLQRRVSSKQIEQIGVKSLSIARRKSLKTTTKYLQMGTNLSWIKDGQQLPSLTTKVIASQLHNTYFQILIWKYQTDEQPQFFADCYVSFYKLFGTEATIENVGNVQYQSRKIEMVEKIEHYGKDFGKGKFTFKITNEPYFKQHQICVLTEVGILKSNPIFGIQQTKAAQKCVELKQLLKISADVEQNVINLSKIQSSEGPIHEIKHYKLTIQSQLENMFKLLQKSSFESLFLYRYSSQSELLKGQKILVELGMKLTEYFEIEDPVINDDCWLILISLIKRSQFSLSHMGFSQKHKKDIQNNKIDSLLKQKLKVSVLYKLFLYKLLSLALNALDRKGSEYQKTFAEIFSAFAYFRIPQFRNQILRLITNQNDPQISEWKGVQFNLADDQSDIIKKDNSNIFSEVFDWEQHFYKWLVKDESLQNQAISLNDILAQESWKQRFSKRGLAFFYFIKYWVTYIQNTLQQDKKNIQWRYFPGYNRLLKGFFAQMKHRNILQYPDALIQTVHKLLINEKIINPFIKIMINKVNIYDTSQVIRLIDYLNMVFKSFVDRKKSLPINFNYSYFFQGLRIILQSQFSLGISSTLTLIYNYFTFFHSQFRRSISLYLLGSNFWHLFLNWSNNVRDIFYHLLTYKIYRQAHHCSGQNKSTISETEILERYDQLMKIIQVKQQKYLKQNKSLQSVELDKVLFKRMKIKAYQKIKKKQQKQNVIIYKAENQLNSISKLPINLATAARLRKTSRDLYQLNKKHHNSQIISNTNIHSSNKENLGLESFGKTCDNFYRKDSIVLIQRIIHQKQFEIKQIEQKMIKNIPIYLPKFKQIQSTFLCCLQKQDETCPIIKYEISIDNREIRPQKIDDW